MSYTETVAPVHPNIIYLFTDIEGRTLNIEQQLFANCVTLDKKYIMLTSREMLEKIKKRNILHHLKRKLKLLITIITDEV